MNRDELIAKFANPQGVLLVAFIATLMWAPLPYGSNRLWAELLLGLGLGALLLAWATLAGMGIAHTTPLIRRLFLPALCIVVALGWGLFQSLDLTLLSRLSGIDLTGLAHPVWSTAASALADDAASYISVDPELTRQAVFAAALSVAAFLISFLLTRERTRADVLLAAFVLISTVYALTAFAMQYFGIDMQSWLMPDAKPSVGRMAGSFVNPNHFATFLALGALAGLGLFVEGLRQATVWDRGSRVLVRTALQAMTGANALWLVATVCIVSALLLTQSRGGVGAFLCGTFALIVALAVGRPRNRSEERGQRAVVAMLIAVVGVAAVVSADPLLGRIGDQGVGDATRATLAASALKSVEVAPVLGQGFGAFQRYYPRVADGSLQGDIDEVHNDPLETLADLGLPAGLVYMAAPLILTVMCFAGCMNRRRDRVFSAVGFAASIAVVIHAFVDFSLQIPAVAVSYATLLGIGVAQSWRTNLDLVR